jgi:hypothetical protein
MIVLGLQGGFQETFSALSDSTIPLCDIIRNDAPRGGKLRMLLVIYYGFLRIFFKRFS